MLNTSVLVLNRSYLPIHVTSVRRAFALIYQGIARAVDEQYQTFDFEGWSQLTIDRDVQRTHPGAACDCSPCIRPRAETSRSFQPDQHLRTRQLYVSVLRDALPALGAQPRSRGPALPGWTE